MLFVGAFASSISYFIEEVFIPLRMCDRVTKAKILCHDNVTFS